MFDVGSNPDDAGQGAHPCAHGSFGVSSRVARSAVSSRVVWPSSSSAASQRPHGNVASDAGSLVTDAEQVRSFGHGENLRSRLTDPNMSTQEQARMRRFAAGVKG